MGKTLRKNLIFLRQHFRLTKRMCHYQRLKRINKNHRKYRNKSNFQTYATAICAMQATDNISDIVDKFLNIDQRIT